MSKPSCLAGLIGSHLALRVAGTVHVPLGTPLLRLARALGCRTLDGGGLAVQAVEAFRLFAGAPDARRMSRRFAEPRGEAKT